MYGRWETFADFIFCVLCCLFPPPQFNLSALIGTSKVQKLVLYETGRFYLPYVKIFIVTRKWGVLCFFWGGEVCVYSHGN